MAECRNFVDMANNFVNTLWRKRFSSNLLCPATSEVPVTTTLNKLRLTWLPSYAPGFYVSSNQILILHEPQSFYKLLLEQIEKAQKRVVLASLYLGNGLLEEGLVSALKKQLEKKPNLKVKILLDCIRGSRGRINSRKMVLPLLKEFEKSCQVCLYQTPFLRGPLTFLPEKYKEIVGLQHMKVYLFDDNFIITGANLSNDYFVKRQDRYMMISNSSEISDFIEGLVDRVSEFSFCLNGDDQLSLNKSWPYNPLKTDPSVFNFAASAHIRNYYESFLGSTRRVEEDTLIFPLVEMGSLGIHVDSKVTKKIFEECSSEVFVYLTTGYFNLTDSYKSTIIERSKAQFRLLMAHPTANSFYKAKGPAGGIPDGYTRLALNFLDKVIKRGQTPRIEMSEYRRDGWTYHAKGLWLSAFESRPPHLTLIGSPNFGERSVEKDLECQFLLATTDENLQKQLLRERNVLYEFSQPFTKATAEDPERGIPFWVEIVVWLFSRYF